MMNDHTNDRFIVLCGHEDLADHILDTAEVQLEETIDEAMELLVDLTDVADIPHPERAASEFEEAKLDFARSCWQR